MADIFDAMIRHQLYLEGLKVNQHKDLLDDTTSIIKLYADEVQSLNVNTLDELSKGQLRTLIATLRSASVKIYSKYTLKFLKFLESFTKTESSMTALIIKEVGEDLLRPVPLAAFGKDFAGKVWASLRNSILPSTGEDFLKYIDGFGSSLIINLEKAIKFATVNAQTKAELLERIKGVKGKVLNKGGLLGRFRNAAKAMIDTTIQHVSSYVQNTVQSLFYDEYIWISIIDEHTTDICEGRHGNVYRYGEGPIPPAHVKCRSRQAPNTDSARKSRFNFREWLTVQPEDIKRLCQEDPKPISLEQYRNKIGSIVR